MPGGQERAAPASTPGRKPDWLKVRLPGGQACQKVQGTLQRLRLHSVCQEAACPNLAECFRAGTATFLILGPVCTRHCRYCRIASGTPSPPDPEEPDRLVAAVQALGLRYAVITSVTRDDLPDGGAGQFARCIRLLREKVPSCGIEVLVPDFGGDPSALAEVLAAGPQVVNHNIEVVPALFPLVRPEGDYQRSLAILEAVDRWRRRENPRPARFDGEGEGPPAFVASKSGFMVGLGETGKDIRGLLQDLAAVRCQRITIGQYLQPSARHWPVRRFYPPEAFAALQREAEALGFSRVEAGPLVRSSYRAGQTV